MKVITCIKYNYLLFKSCSIHIKIIGAKFNSAVSNIVLYNKRSAVYEFDYNIDYEATFRT